MSTADEVKRMLGDVLQLGPGTAQMTESIPLLGEMMELDSIAVRGVITGLQEHFGIAVADEELTADIFATLGSLAGFVDRKLGPNGLPHGGECPGSVSGPPLRVPC